MEQGFENEMWKNDKTFFWTCVTYLSVLLAFICVRVISGFGLLDGLSDEVVEVCFSVVSQVLIMLLIPLISIKVLSKKNYRQTLSSFGFNKPNTRVVGYSFLLGILLYLFNMFVAAIFSTILSLFGYRFPVSGGGVFVGLSGLIISLILIGVLPGFCEEANHRGMLLNGLVGKLGVWRAVLFSSLIFGLMHLNIVQFFYATILGYIIALAVLATRSIWTGVIMHFMNNAIGTYLSYARDNKWFLSDVLDPIINLFAQPYGILLLFAFIYGVYWLIMEIIHKFARERYFKSEKIIIAKYMQENPSFVAQKIERGESVSIDEVSQKVKQQVETLDRRNAIKFYVDNHKKPVAMSLKEKTVFYGIIFLGVITTVFTFVWGLL